MSDNNNPNKNDMAAIAHSIGQLSGKMDVMQQSITDSISVIRQDLRRMEDSTKESMQHLESRVNEKVKGVSDRVKILEEGEKKTIQITAKHSVIGAGLGAAITYGFVELLKRLH